MTEPSMRFRHFYRFHLNEYAECLDTGRQCCGDYDRTFIWIRIEYFCFCVGDDGKYFF